MKTYLSMTFVAALLLLGAGCKNKQQTASATNPPPPNQAVSASATPSGTPATTPEQLGALGADIKKHPNDAHKLLADRGMTEESFAAAIRKVSEDPAAAKRYAAAFKQANQ